MRLADPTPNPSRRLMASLVQQRRDVAIDRPGLRIVGLNIQHGGLPRAKAIAAALETLDPDVVVLSEAWPFGRGQPLIDLLAPLGLMHVATSESDHPKVPSAVTLALQIPMKDAKQPLGSSPHRQRVLEATVGDVVVAGVYFPLGREKVAFWRHEFLAYARARLTGPTVLVGDWNSGKPYSDEAGATLLAAKEFEEMSTMGWTDAWSIFDPDGREFSWYSQPPHQNGFRLDHAFLSPSVAPRLVDARLGHETREQRVSDYTPALIVNLS